MHKSVMLFLNSSFDVCLTNLFYTLSFLFASGVAYALLGVGLNEMDCDSGGQTNNKKRD